MKYAALLALALLPAIPAKATYWAGISDMSIAPSPVAFYEFVNKEPRSGMDKPIWHLNEGKADGTVAERIHIGAVLSWNVVNANPAVCASAGTPLGSLGSVVGGVVDSLAPSIPDAPLALKDAANFVTVEGFFGHELAGSKWVGGIGGKIKVKYDMADLLKLFK